MNLSFQKLFFPIATVFAIFAILILAKTILIPLGFALLVSFILYPLARRYELWGANILFAAFLSILTVIIIIFGAIYLFSTQIISLSSEFSDIQDRILSILADISLYTNNNISFIPNLEKGELFNRIKEWFTESSGLLLKQTFNSTTAITAGLLLAIVYTFLILIYREGIIHAFCRFFPEDKREQARRMFRSVQRVGKQYLFGMLMIMFIVGLLNSIGLLIVGLDNPFLFGFMAAILTIIPYVGTFLGAALPVLYAFVSYDSPWIAVSVAVMFWVVQIIESNFLTPKIVGGNVKINALTAILSIIIGAAVWGVAGMILFLPFAAMLRVVCEHYIQLQPIALLIGEQNVEEKEDGTKFLNRWRDKIKSWFFKPHISEGKSPDETT